MPFAEIRWTTAALDLCRKDPRWPIYGSVVDARWPEFTTAAAALVVVSCHGELVASAEVRLPASVCAAPAAEAAALEVAVTVYIAVPFVIADCMSLLSNAAAGTVRATHASRPLAAVRCAIVTAFDANVAT